jgi:glycosyltransferase involved in cell wall biosynthesis
MKSRLVLHVINSLGLSGGAEQQLFSNLERFKNPALRHHVAYLYQDADPSWIGQMPAPVTALNGSAESTHLVTSGTRLWRLVRELEPDLIHCSLVDASLVSRIVGRMTGTPILESLVNISHEPIRTVDSSAVKNWKLAFYRGVDRVTIGKHESFHALTEEVARSWTDTIGIDRSRITVVPRGVAIEELESAALTVGQRQDLRMELVGDPVTPIVLAIGREEPQKGHRYLIEAMDALVKAGSDAHLVMAGRSGSSSRMISDLISGYGLHDRVHRLGVRSDVYRLMQAPDMMVFPSLFEGLGVSLIEAMGSGLPVVVFDRPPMNQIVSHDLTGMVVPDRDTQALTGTMQTLLSDRALRARLGRAASEEVRAEYDLDKTSVRVEEMYVSILDGSHR